MPKPLPPDPWKALGVSKDDDLENIRRVYRKLVLTCHPDKFPDEAVKAQKSEEFHKVQQAWELLSDKNKFAEYQGLCNEHTRFQRSTVEFAAHGGGRSWECDDYGPRSATGTKYETRGDAVYEERVPKPRSFDDKYGSPDFDDHRSNDHRSNSRKFDARYDAPPPTPRRASTRVVEEKRSERRDKDDDDHDRVVRKWKEAIRIKQAERTIHADRRKSRDKTRRQDYDSKRSTHARVESDSETESEVEVFMGSNRRSAEPRTRHEEVSRSRHDVSHGRKSKGSDSDYSDGRESKLNSTFKLAASYISKSSGKSPVVEISDRHRPSLPRHSSSRTAVPPPPPPPPQPPISSIDNARRSSGSSSRRGSHATRSTTKERKVTEIVDPPEREYDSSRRPHLSSSASSPLHVKIPPPLSPKVSSRAHTLDVRSSEKTPSPLRRNQTSPLAYMSSPAHVPSKSSRLRSSETPEPGYSSPGTQDYKPSHTPQYTSKIYKYISEDDEEDGERTPRIVPIQPEYRTHERDRERDISPRTLHRAERSSHTRGSSRSTTKRTQSYADSPRHPPPIVRSSTGRPEDARSGKLYGEISQSPPREDKYNVHYAPRYEATDIKYADTLRRSNGSDSARDHRDAYAYESKGGREGHPGMGSRGVSSYAQGAY